MGCCCCGGDLSYAKSGAACSEREGRAASASWSVRAIHRVEIIDSWGCGAGVEARIGLCRLLMVVVIDDCDPPRRESGKVEILAWHPRTATACISLCGSPLHRGRAGYKSDIPSGLGEGATPMKLPLFHDRFTQHRIIFRAALWR